MLALAKVENIRGVGSDIVGRDGVGENMKRATSAIGLDGEIGALVEGEADDSVLNARFNAERSRTDFYLLERLLGDDFKGERLVGREGKKGNRLALLLLTLMTGPTAVKGRGGYTRRGAGGLLSVHSNDIIVAYGRCRNCRVNMITHF